MSQTTLKELASLREKFKDKKIVFCSGCFDLFHAGHVLFFEDCKKLGDILVVGIGPDVDMKPYKGEDRPILNETVRLKMTNSVKPVDYAFILPSFLGLDSPLAVVSQVLDELKPDIYAVNDDAFDIPYRENMIKKTKTELVILKRWCPPEFDHISATKLINKIKKSDPKN